MPSKRDFSEVNDKDSEENEINTRNKRVSLAKQNLYESQNYANNLNLETENESRKGEAGTISSITLINFMCHKYLHIDLGPAINFIIGHNGSGKSAVLTAITICLGGKASVTQRATSIKSLIKDGATYTKVIVELNNKGENSFQPGIYGNRIQVERHIDKSGLSRYTLKSDKNKIITKRKDDLDIILDWFDLKVDNKMAIMSQDTARSFLSNSTPNEKYQFFMKGLSLIDFENEILMLEHSIRVTSNNLRNKRSILKLLEEDRDNAEKLLKQTKDQMSLHEELKKLSYLHAWCRVRDYENKVQEKSKMVQETLKEVEDLQIQLTNLESKIEICQDAIKELEEEFDRKHIESDQIVQQARDARHEVNELITEKESILAQERSIGESIERATNRIKELKDTIKEEEARNNKDTSPIMNNLEKNNKNLRQITESLAIKTDLSYQDDIEKYEKDIRDIKYKLKGREKRENDLKITIRRIKDSASNRLGNYHRSLTQALDMINRNKHQFRQIPYGPIASYISLKDAKWRHIVDHIIPAPFQTGFAVTNREDQARLNDILRRCNCRSSIYVRADDNFDYTHAMPPNEFLTVLDVLHFENEFIKRLAIDCLSIERRVLVEERSQAEAVASRGIRSILQVYSLNRNDRRGGLEIGSRTKGVSKTAPFHPPELLLIKSDAREDLEDAEREFGIHSRQSRELEVKLRQFQDEQRKLRGQEQSNIEDIRSLKRRQRTIEGEIQRLKDELQMADEGVLESLRDNIHECEEGKVILEKEYYEVIYAKDRNLKELSIKEKNANILRKKSEENNAKLADTEHKISLKRKDMREIGELIRKISEDKIRKSEELKTLKSEVYQVETKKNEITKKVMDYCGERIDVGDSDTAVIKKKALALRDRILEIEKRLGSSLDEIIKDFNEKDKSAKDAKDIISDWSRLEKLMTEALVSRKQFYEDCTRRLIRQAKTAFAEKLRKRGFSGRLIIDRMSKKLQMSVKTNENEVSDGGENTRTLSGGERSFTQICLILALWEAMNIPVRALDEFDVFMDALNRRIGMNMMIEAAGSNVYSNNFQTIFITPQSMENISKSHNVSIYRMRDPRG